MTRPAWTKAQIRRARQAPLKPLLESLGYQLQPLKNGNYQLCRLAVDIVVKDHYWVARDTGAAACAEPSRSGNAIDFLVEVEGMAFAQAMHRLIAYTAEPEAPACSHCVADTAGRS